MFLHRRKIYLDRIAPYIHAPVVKVITGMRRVGKSCFLRLIRQDLETLGVGEDRIIFIDMESLEFDHLRDYRALHAYVQQRFPPGAEMVYLFIDEIQMIQGWERCIASLHGSGRFDIFISGSNAGMLSSDLATALAGRYVEFPLYSLGLQEFLQFTGHGPEEGAARFPSYLRFGGFPVIPRLGFEEEVVYQYINSLYDTILLKDVVKRYKIRNIDLLDAITRYAFDNIGNVLSAKRVADYLKSQRLAIGVDTVQKYLGYLCSAYVLHKVRRYDIRGRRLLEIHDKYYLGDIGLRHALLGYREGDISGILENIVFLELRRRGYMVHIGKIGHGEIDFIATRAKEKAYIQVAYLLAAPETVEREFSPLLAVKDNYPKYVLSMDDLFGHDFEGVRRLHLVDFLLQDPRVPLG